MRHPCNLCSLQFATEKILEKHVAYFHINPDASRVQPILPVVLEKIKIEPELIRLDEEDHDDHQTTSAVQKQLPKAIFEKTAITQIVKRLKPKDSYQCEVCLETFSLLRYFRKHLATPKEQGFFKCQEYYKTNINNGYLPYNKSCMEGIANAEHGQTTENEQSRSQQRTTAVRVQTCKNSKDEEHVVTKTKIGSKNKKQRSDFVEKQGLSNIVDNNMHFQRRPKSYGKIIPAVKCTGKAVNDVSSEQNNVIYFENQSKTSTGNAEVQMPVQNTPDTLPTPQVTPCKECHLTCASYEQLCVHYSKHHNLPVVVLDPVEKHELYLKYKRHVDSFSKNNIFKCDTCPGNFSDCFISEKHTTSGPCTDCHFSDVHLKTSKNDISSIGMDKLKSRIDLCRKNIKKYSKEPYEPRKNNFSTLSLLRKHTFSTKGKNCHKCKICKRQFSTPTMLKNHKFVVHNVKEVSLFNVQQRRGKRISATKIRKRVGQINCTNCHQCNVCQQEFSTQLQLTQHKAIVHQQNSFECDLCLKKYSRKYSLTLHKLNAHEKYRFRCDLCEKDFSSKRCLKRHRQGSHDGFHHKCDLCPKDFPLLVSLKTHKLTVHNGVRHKCESCPKTYTQLGHLNQHKRTAHEFVRHKCDSCPKTFSQLSTLKKHKLSVHEGVRHNCELCPKTFTQLGNLNLHKRYAHEGVRYKCESCLKTFSQLEYLNQHKKSVHDGFPHKCESCSKTFTHLGHLNLHKRTVHEGVRHKCESCSKTFSQLGHLNLHKRTVHEGVRHKCESCSKTFTQLGYLNQHNRTVHNACRM